LVMVFLPAAFAMGNSLKCVNDVIRCTISSLFKHTHFFMQGKEHFIGESDFSQYLQAWQRPSHRVVVDFHLGAISPEFGSISSNIGNQFC